MNQVKGKNSFNTVLLFLDLNSGNLLNFSLKVPTLLSEAPQLILQCMSPIHLSHPKISIVSSDYRMILRLFR